ncbi:Ger(x)C family spore germination C-terminal domain-containing protein [Paenibacillus sp. P26]|nr:Ger(x)C family spore germination C-terminal domain-containing protein [Paenibacillus sp. P26]
MDMLKQTNLPSALKLGRLAVLKEGKMIGWLEQNETQGIAFMSDNFRSGSITFACNQKSEGSNQNTVHVIRSNTKLTPMLENGRFKMKIVIEGKGVLMETGCSLDLNDPKSISQLEELASQDVRRKIDLAWKKTKGMKVDIMGFAEAIHHRFPKEWKKIKKDWDSSLASMTIEPHIKISIEHVGLSNKSFKLLNKKDGGD